MRWTVGSIAGSVSRAAVTGEPRAGSPWTFVSPACKPVHTGPRIRAAG